MIFKVMVSSRELYVSIFVKCNYKMTSVVGGIHFEVDIVKIIIYMTSICNQSGRHYDR